MFSIFLKIAVLVFMICVLVGLPDRHNCLSRKSPFEQYYSAEFEDLIPDDEKFNHKDFPVSFESYEDPVLTDLNTALNLKSEDDNDVVINEEKNIGTESEVNNIIKAAFAFKMMGKNNKSIKLLEHANALVPDNADVLNWYGEFLEQHQDIVSANHLYSRALTFAPNHEAALSNRKRTNPIVDSMDFKLLNEIDNLKVLLKNYMKLDNFDAIKKQAFYLHIYHTVGIEGNTMSVEQLRYVLETGHVVNGKSILEHNEILGLEKAMQYVKLLTHAELIGMNEILGIHRRVMGYADPLKSGVLRNERVFVGGHIPPPHEDISDLMEKFVDWLNSEEAHSLHAVRYAALAHYKLVDIHPFADGNGRTARLLMNLILLRLGYPPVMILKEQREKYYHYLRAANMGDVKPFVRFIAQCTLNILRMYLHGTKALSIDGPNNKIVKY